MSNLTSRLAAVEDSRAATAPVVEAPKQEVKASKKEVKTHKAPRNAGTVKTRTPATSNTRPMPSDWKDIYDARNPYHGASAEVKMHKAIIGQLLDFKPCQCTNNCAKRCIDCKNDYCRTHTCTRGCRCGGPPSVGGNCLKGHIRDPDFDDLLAACGFQDEEEVVDCSDDEVEEVPPPRRAFNRNSNRA
jgi:hypothetical protein